MLAKISYDVFFRNLNAAERRKQLIQESKFLGGDMEHTHLVKGLDYALLQKVRSEIEATEKEVIYIYCVLNKVYEKLCKRLAFVPQVVIN